MQYLFGKLTSRPVVLPEHEHRTQNTGSQEPEQSFCSGVDVTLNQETVQVIKLSRNS